VGLKESTENHEERMTEMEIKSNSLEEEQGALRIALKEVKEQEARVENEMREGDMENRVQINHMNEEMQQFFNGTVKHLEELE
jgi:predicted  nucleic acid-binding Zn-ribbon protein